MLCKSHQHLFSLRLSMNFIKIRLMSGIGYKVKLKECYNLLKVKEGCDQETMRRAFLDLAKRYHPDSGSPEANAEKFKEIESAFRFLNKKYSQDRWGVEENTRIEEFNIKHTAPQHRQYLSYGGMGSGTPAQREKQFAKRRASQAVQNVMEHRMEKALATEGALMDKSNNKKQKHNIKTQYGFDRLVEDLIQEAMSRGEFNDLPGSGKPLSSLTNTNPYVDFVTHKVNQVLIDNGFTPEWITLQKEIRQEVETLRTSLEGERCRIGPLPLTENELELWSQVKEKHKQITKNINNKINHYNLVVPILQKQMFLVSLDKEAEDVLRRGKNKTQVVDESLNENNFPSQDGGKTFMSIFSSIFK